MTNLSNVRSNSKGLTDYLPYFLFIDEGTILNKSGSISAAYSYCGDDLDSLTDEEKNMLKRHLNKALMQFGTNWMFNIDCDSREINGYPDINECKFPDATSFVIDQERRSRYNQSQLHFKNFYTLIFTYLPPNDAEAKFTDSLIVGKKQREINYERHLRYFYHKLENFVNEIGSKLKLSRLNTNEFFSYIHGCITGKAKFRRLNSTIVDLDYLLGVADINTTLTLKVNKNYCKVLTIVDFPKFATPGILHALTELKFEYRWSTRYLILSTEDADILLRKRMKTWFGKRETAKQLVAKSLGSADTVSDPSDVGNMDAGIYANEAKQAVLDNQLGKEKNGFYTSVILVFDENEESLNSKVKAIEQVLSDKFFHAHEETIGSNLAYLGSLPALDWANLRMPVINTRYLCDIMPLYSVWSGLDKNPNPLLKELGINNPPLLQCVTSGAQPFSWSFHVDSNGHGLVIGPDPAQSVLLNLIAAQAFKYDQAKVFFFDRQKTAMALCYGVGGQYYDIGSTKSDVHFQPLRDLSAKHEIQLAKIFIKLLCEIKIRGFINFTTEQEQHIDAVLGIMAVKPISTRTLSSFVTLMKPKDSDIARAVEHYTSSGPYGLLFDSNEVKNDFTSARMVCFEMEYLEIQFGPEALIPLSVYIFNKLLIELFPKKLPIYIIIKESWKALSSEKFSQYLEEVLRAGNRNNVSLVLATSQPTDVIDNNLKNILITQCQTKIYLPNAEATNEIVRKVYRSIGLNDKQISIIANSSSGRSQYYYTSPYGKRLFELDICDYTRCFTVVHDIELTQQIYNLDKSKFAYNWVMYFAEKHNNQNLRNWANYWLEINNKFNNPFKEFNDGRY